MIRKTSGPPPTSDDLKSSRQFGQRSAKRTIPANRPVEFARRCRACDLDFQAYNIGDGPAAFLILIVGAVLVVSAILVDLRFSPPWWVHGIWLPVGILLTISGLRIGKAALLYQSHLHQAREGRIDQ